MVITIEKKGKHGTTKIRFKDFQKSKIPQLPDVLISEGPDRKLHSFQDIEESKAFILELFEEMWDEAALNHSP